MAKAGSGSGKNTAAPALAPVLEVTSRVVVRWRVADSRHCEGLLLVARLELVAELGQEREHPVRTLRVRCAARE